MVAAEIVWHQGVDVYAEQELRYTAAMELLAGQFLSGTPSGLSRGSNKVAQERFDSMADVLQSLAPPYGNGPAKHKQVYRRTNSPQRSQSNPEPCLRNTYAHGSSN